MQHAFLFHRLSYANAYCANQCVSTRQRSFLKATLGGSLIQVLVERKAKQHLNIFLVSLGWIQQQHTVSIELQTLVDLYKA